MVLAGFLHACSFAFSPKSCADRRAALRLVVITGTSSGLGKHTTKALLQAKDYHVIGAVRGPRREGRASKLRAKPRLCVFAFASKHAPLLRLFCSCFLRQDLEKMKLVAELEGFDMERFTAMGVGFGEL